MTYIKRKIFNQIQLIIEQGKSVLFLGPRQTGKTTLTEPIESDRILTFSDPRIRQRYEQNPGLLINELAGIEKKDGKELLVIIDEVQKVPAIMDAVQYLIDKHMAKFILTGSSARKLKRNDNINLLPGRVIPIHLDALMIGELPTTNQNIDDLLLYGSLPEITLTKDHAQKEKLLEAYVITYLEEEVRAEAIVRDLASFGRFLELAASEAGYAANASKLSQTVGVAGATIDAYYQILEDCLIAERIEPICESKTRHRLSQSSKFLFFDLGVRRLAAREGKKPPLKFWGHLFEQFVGIECIRLSRFNKKRTRIKYWKDLNGPEVDWVIEQEKFLTPIEVKWTDKPSLSDAKHLKIFLKEYENSQFGYIICQTPHRMKLSDNIFAIPWQELDSIFKD